jgi:hypothetical protein
VSWLWVALGGSARGMIRGERMVTSLTVIGSSNLSSEVMCSYGGESDEMFMHALYSCYSCIYINTAYLYHRHTKSRNAAL